MARAKKIVTDSGVVRSNRFFLSLKAIGEVDEKGKTILSLGYKGKIIATPDRPLSTAVAKLILHVAEMVQYSDEGQRDADLKALKKFVVDME